MPISFKRNEKVFYQGTEYAIFKVMDFKHVIIRDQITNGFHTVQIAELSDRAPDEEKTQDPYDVPIESYPEKKLQKAQWRLSIITPFLGELKGDKKMLTRTAKAHNLNPSTLYKWIAKFDTYGHIGCLVDSYYKGGKDKGRLGKEQENQISEIINEVYLDAKKFSKTYRAIAERFKELGFEVPHENTVRRRIKLISEYEKTSKKMGPRTASQKYDPKPGTTPHAKTPLSLVQIDHTQLDIMLVDEEERKPFKRPWITVLIDVFSRMVLGYYISFEAPSAFAVGRALSMAVFPKEKFLKSIGLPKNEWPCWGKMTTLYCDNAKEFRGEMLKESCANYNITLKWRPPRKPEMAGHIERLMGTIAEELKDLAGNTNVGKEMRSKFKPEKSACFTLAEFEKWFTTWVTDVYHVRPHKGIDGMMPMEKWNEGIFGSNRCPGIGMPEIITDEDKFKLDVLPQYKRTVQRTGIHLLKFKYFSGILRKWVNSVDHTSRGKVKPKRKFVFKMDPRNISAIFFLDPTDSKYHEIPSTLNIKPDKMSIWDYRRAVEELRKNRKPVNGPSIYAAYKRMNEMEDQSKKKTREAKKRAEMKSRMNKEEPPKTVPANVIATEIKEFKTTKIKIEAYEELEFDTYGRSFK
jgi:putative transposase